MIKVTKKQFYEYVNPRDICLDCKENVTNWTTRSGYLVGTSGGYLTPEINEYALTEEAYETWRKENEEKCVC